MEKIVDFRLEKTRKEAIGHRDSLEAEGKDILNATIQALEDLKAIMQMDYNQTQEKVQGFWEVYTYLSAMLADLCIGLYQLNEPDLQKKLQEITEELQKRMK